MSVENINTTRAIAASIAGAISAAGAWLSAKMGILLPVLSILAMAMIIDYVSGMAASKYEGMEHPDDPAYGWSSKKGAKGILKKFGYLCVIMVAMVVDYVMIKVAAETGIEVDVPAFFGLLVTIWYILNELLSIVENAGRMGAGVPKWLTGYIAVLKNKIDTEGGMDDGNRD